MSRKIRIIYLGTPEFAVSSLEALISEGYDVAAVVTAPDQPSGRGLQLRPSPVKICALGHHIPLLQPEKLKDEAFLRQLRDFNADLFIVVAFRMLPEAVWKMPPLGTFNLHASLLPQYRGAAPIHHAIMNGEPETGITTFFLSQEIDTGEIIFQEKMPVGPDETAGELHDRMKISGARLVLKTVDAISRGTVRTIDQKSLYDTGIPLKTAPKIFRDDCRLDWSCSTADLYNKVRGLTPVPAAFTLLVSPAGEIFQLKVFKTKQASMKEGMPPAVLLTDGRNFLTISTKDGALLLEEVQLEGKRRMTVPELLRGFPLNSDWKVG